MAWKKSYSKKRRFNKRKSFKKYKGFRVNKRGQLIHYFKRTQVTEIEVRNNGFVTGLISNDYELNDVPGNAEFTAIYDDFKICAIKNKFVFNRNSANVSTANHELPMLITVNDYNDVTELASEAVALEYKSYKASRLGGEKTVSRYFKPRVLEGSTEGKRRWLKTSETTRDHHGLKMALDTIGTANDTVIGTLRIYTTWYLAFKNPR